MMVCIHLAIIHCIKSSGLLTEGMFLFTCFNPEDPHDPSVGLINGQLAIPGNLLKREVFDPVVNEVCLGLLPFI